jgi:hypothetical protein
LTVYFPPEWLVEQWGVVTMFINMVVVYNLIFDSLSVPISLAIIVKEVSLEFF